MLRRREALALPAALLSQGLVNAAALTQNTWDGVLMRPVCSSSCMLSLMASSGACS